jgi:Amt family ammonium transporter
MDNLAEHGIAGMVGLIFNGLFAADYIIGLDGVSTGIINGGWINHNWKQLYIQVAYVVACTAYSFVVSALIAGLVNLVPGLNLRASEEAELLGMDDDQLGEFAYDYVEVRRDYLAWTPATDDMQMVDAVEESQKMANENLRMRNPSANPGYPLPGEEEITPAAHNRLHSATTAGSTHQEKDPLVRETAKIK